MNDELNLTFNENELRILKYMIKGSSNTELLFQQMPDGLKEKVEEVLGDVWMNPEDFDNLQDLVNYLSYLDQVPRHRDPITKQVRTRFHFLQNLAKNNEDLFIELGEFIFLPAKKRKINESDVCYYSFSSDTREEIADAAIEEGIFAEKIIKHYFTLLAKNCSWSQKKRIDRWIKMPQVKNNKLLMMILASSKHSEIAIYAIENVEKKSLPLLVSDVKHHYAKWYLEKKLSDFKFPENISIKVENSWKKGQYHTVTGRHAATRLYHKETGKEAWK